MEKETIRAAVFDFDGTMIRGDSIVRLIRFAVGRGALSPLALPGIALRAAAGRLGLCPMEKVKERTLRFETKLPPARREQLLREFVSGVLLPDLIPEAVRAWETMRSEGCRMVIASASTSDYMTYVAQALGADALLCTEIRADGTVGANCRGAEKARRVRAWAEKENAALSASHGFGDSAGDIAFLRLCGHAHAVRPRRGLRREAEAQGWEIHTWN